MPIKPENKARYPKNWRDIRQMILIRADDKCEACKAENRTRIARGQGDDAGTYITGSCDVYCDTTGEHLGQRAHYDFDVGRMVEVVLTIAHLDHTPENCDPANLRAWCQKCHLTYDAKHHQANAAVTRKTGKAIGDLFAEPSDPAAGAQKQNQPKGAPS